MTTTYTLTRTFDGDDSPYHSTSFTTSDADHVNAAHMLAAGFNTMSRNFLNGFVLGVIDTETGSVQYDGKLEKLDRPESKQTPEKQRSDYAHVDRSVLESAYADHMCIREWMYEAGVETIPVSAGVNELRAQINEYRKRESEQRGARNELISFVKRAHVKKDRLTVGDVRPDLEDRWRGMLDALAKFLVVTGEADADEGHAVARRLCGIGVDGDE